MAIERMYTPEQALPYLGVKHVNEVYRALRDGKLVGRKRILRGHGTRPRLLIPESSIERFQDAMASTAEEPVIQGARHRPGNALVAAADDAGGEPSRQRPPKPRKRRGGKAGASWVEEK